MNITSNFLSWLCQLEMRKCQPRSEKRARLNYYASFPRAAFFFFFIEMIYIGGGFVPLHARPEVRLPMFQA